MSEAAAGTATSWPAVLSALIAGSSLSADDTAWAMDQMMSGEATSAQVAAFAVALRAKGETPAELEGLVRTMLAFAVPVPVAGPALDIVGSGGDRSHTVNISTMAALTAAGAGVRVAKHGNRAASSSCGAADLLEALGVAIDLDGEAVAACVESVGIGFCFAPVFHPALRHVASARAEIGVGTVFNFLGPLTNPARPAAQAVGCADPAMAAVMAGVLAARGTRALVFRGDDGLDELTTTTTSQVWVVADGVVTHTTLDPRNLGIAPAAPADLRGGDVARNAEIARRMLGGERGPVRDAVLLNAAAGIVAADGPDPAKLTEQLAAATVRCAEAIDAGSATDKLKRWVAFSRERRG